MPNNQLISVASSSGKLTATNLKFGSMIEFVCALAEALPNLLPAELSVLFDKFRCETFFDTPVTKLREVIKALEVRGRFGYLFDSLRSLHPTKLPFCMWMRHLF